MVPRTFTAYQALARQAMTMRQLREACEWTDKQAAAALHELCRTGQVRRASRPNVARFVYEVKA
jgi:predicted transcriptional regulator